MVSSRRLAREWALKILYQIDVGKFSLSEAQEAAMERLRLEFVQRGSRSASGSQAEEIALDFLTCDLRDILPMLRVPMERALAVSVGRLFGEMPYWQEARFERSFRTQAPGVLLVPARLLTPLPDSVFLPSSSSPSEGLSVQLTALTPEETARYRRFVLHAREELPRLLEPEFKKTGLRFAKELAQSRPLGATPDELQAFLRARREAFNTENAERWRKVGTMVQKQTSDWLRTAAFTVKLAHGVQTMLMELDQTLGALASGWRLERQVAVDRNILRLAAFEMLSLPGIPTGASINEAVELAKKYSTAESGRFVNGVLGALAARVGDKLTPPDASVDAIEAVEQDTPLDLPDISDIEDTDAD